MGAFFRDYGTQIALAIAVLNTVISAIVGLQNNPISRFALVVASVALGGLAVGALFYSQHQIVASGEAEVQKRLAMKDLLHAAIGDNETLLARQRTQSKDDVNAYLNEANTWTAKTGQLIEDAYGKGERDVFMNDAGINPINAVNNQNALVGSELIARLQRLNELMSRVDTISMQPNFDPNNYHAKAAVPLTSAVGQRTTIYAVAKIYEIWRGISEAVCAPLTITNRSDLTTSVAMRRGQQRSAIELFGLSRLRCKNPQKLGDLLPDVDGVAGQHQVGLCDQFGPLISIVKGENRWLTFLRRRTVMTFGHVKSRFQILGDLAFAVLKQNSFKSVVVQEFFPT